MPEAGADPLAARCPACLADPGRPCTATSSDLPRELAHKLRPLAAATRLRRCPNCAECAGWTPSVRTPADPAEVSCPVCAAPPGATCTESGNARATWHEVRVRAAALALEPCGACDGIGWIPDPGPKEDTPHA
ncbi:zinc finger domain-containing protein [Actinomadura litoris]|uniref:DNA-binding phage zinc finger domain-containing protein n=1 Tax=Actinomadura litoris TaxID=2678616 RepID=A0A7K1LAH8_9ACTN|nr:hypothetical protein [Actinomadura litoris]MUN41429.1 hypothetical protein [Actinomadura litoris]